eukprot:351790-Chlamydomonas_euryale.AAC.2
MVVVVVVYPNARHTKVPMRVGQPARRRSAPLRGRPPTTHPAHLGLHAAAPPCRPQQDFRLQRHGGCACCQDVPRARRGRIQLGRGPWLQHSQGREVRH